MFMQLNLLWLPVLFSFYPHRSPDAVRGGVNHPVKQGKCRTLARDFLLLGTLDPTFNVNPCMPMGAYSTQRNCLQVICKTKGNLLRGLPQSTAVEGFLLCLAGAGSRRGLNCWTSAGMGRCNLSAGMRDLTLEAAKWLLPSAGYREAWAELQRCAEALRS